MKLFELFYIAEGYREAETEFAKVADPATVRQTISTYKELVNKNQFKGNERNIDFWRKQGWENFYNSVTKVASTPTPTQTKRSKIVGKSINVFENDRWLIVIPVDKNASCFHGKTTDWCTAKPDRDHYESYFYDKEITLIYCLNKVNGSKWAIAAHPKLDQIECFDQEDQSLEPEEFKSQTGLGPVSIVRRVHKDFGDELASNRNQYKEYKRRLSHMSHSELFVRNEKIEEMLLYVKDPELCANYVYVCGKGNYPETIALLAIKYSGALVRNIENLTNKIIATIARDKPEDLLYIDDVSPEIQKKLVAEEPYNIEYLNHPTEEIQKQVLKDHPHLIDRVHNLSYEAAKIAVKEDPLQVKNCYFQTPEIHKIAVTEDPYIIKYIEDPATDIQEIAVNDHPQLIRDIKTPSRETQLLAFKRAFEEGYSNSEIFELVMDIHRSIRCPEIKWAVAGRTWTKNIKHHIENSEFLPNTNEDHILLNMKKFIKDIEEIGSDNLQTKGSKKGYKLVKDFLDAVDPPMDNIS